VVETSVDRLRAFGASYNVLSHPYHLLNALRFKLTHY
jgi:hypothetical protein